MALQEHPEWRTKYPCGPVHWDITCDHCGKVFGPFPPHGPIHGKMFHGIDFSPRDYKLIGICKRRNGMWLCKVCAPIDESTISEEE